MYFLPEKLDKYIVAHSEQEPELLQQLTRETYQKVLQPIMLSGPYQGRVLSKTKIYFGVRNFYWIFYYLFSRRLSR